MLIELNQNLLEILSATEKKIIQFINENAQKLPELSIVDIAFETFSSPSTVSRAIRKCGINGFNELRYRTTTATTNNDIQNINEIIIKSLWEAQRVIEQIPLVNILDIIQIIKKAKKVVVLSRGLTEYVAQEFTLKLQIMDYPAIEIHDPNIMRIKSKKLTNKDVMIIFSLYGQTKELIESAQNANLCGTTVIVCCCNKESPLLPYSHYNIVGFKHSHAAIKDYEVSSRVPLFIISRIIIDYLTLEYQ